MAAPPRIGMVYPSNGSCEREFSAFAPAAASLHFTRWAFPDAAWFRPDPAGRMASLAHDPALGDCAALFRQIDPAVVTLACTSASFAAGDEAILAMLAARTDAAVSSTSTAFRVACRSLSISKVAVASIYQEALTQRLLAFLAAAGIETVAHSSAGWESLPPPEEQLTPGQVVAMVRSIDRRDADAVLVPETDIVMSPVIPLLEQELAKPVLGAAQVTVWHAVRLAGIDGRQGIGRLWSAGCDPVLRACAADRRSRAVR